MADYTLLRMRLRQENKLANVSSKINRQLALSDYRQALEINNRVVEETIMRNDSNKLSPAMQGYYWERVKELTHLRAQHPHFRSRYD